MGSVRVEVAGRGRGCAKSGGRQAGRQGGREEGRELGGDHVGYSHYVFMSEGKRSLIPE